MLKLDIENGKCYDTDEGSNKASCPLGAGAIAGIVIGVLLVVGGIGFFVYKKKGAK